MEENDPIKLFTYLIHEMIHLWQQDHGKPSRSGYHNKQFAEKCNSIGITAESPDGKNTGQLISSNIIPNGKAEKAIMEIPEELVFPWYTKNLQLPGEENGKPEAPAQNGGKRSAYTCPICGIKAWGRPGLKIGCLTDSRPLIEQIKE